MIKYTHIWTMLWDCKFHSLKELQILEHPERFLKVSENLSKIDTQETG